MYYDPNRPLPVTTRECHMCYTRGYRTALRHALLGTSVIVGVVFMLVSLVGCGAADVLDPTECCTVLEVSTGYTTDPNGYSTPDSCAPVEMATDGSGLIYDLTPCCPAGFDPVGWTEGGAGVVCAKGCE